MRGIISAGGYLPYRRLDRASISEFLGSGGGRGQRTVASYDEDTTTMGVEAGRVALANAPDGLEPEALWFATVAPAYLDKTNATTIHAALRLTSDIALDFGGAARSAVGALKTALAGNGSMMLVTSDLRTGQPGGSDEANGGDGAAALIVGSDSDGPVIAEYLGGASTTEEFIERWRVPGEDASGVWEERFGEIQYAPLVESAWKRGLDAAGVGPEQVNKLIVSGLHARAVRNLTPRLGASKEALVNDRGATVGNTGAAQAALLLTDALEQAAPGDIIALVSLAETDTGDTLCDTDHQVVLERMRFPDPVISVSVKAKLKTEAEKFGAALGKMVRADPSLHLETDRETNETILRGMGELHLEVTLDRMRTEFGVEGVMGEPQVAYRESFTKSVDEHYVHKKQTGGSGQFAEVWIKFEPLPRGTGFEFVDETTGGSVPREFVPAVEKGLKIQKEDGVLAHFPTVDFRASLHDGSYHDVDSNALTFEIAAKACFREGIRKAGPQLLEPVMKVETVTPGDYLGDVIGDMNRRRGTILDQIERGANIAVVATVPLSEMFGYIGQLRSMSSGRASFTMEFSHYDPVPKNVADEVIADVAKRKAALNA